MFGATVSTPLPLLLEVPLRLRLGLRLVPRYRYCLEFRALRLGSLLGLGLPITAKARSRAMDRSTARARVLELPLLSISFTSFLEYHI